MPERRTNKKNKELLDNNLAFYDGNISKLKEAKI